MPPEHNGLILAALLIAVLTSPAPALAHEPSGADGALFELVENAVKHIGAPYKAGGSDENGFDCSGLIGMLLGSSGKTPRTSAALGLRMPRVGSEGLKRGHLVFFNTRGAPFSHVGLYVGSGFFLHAPGRGQRVKISDMSRKYWKSRFDGARLPWPSGSPPSESHKPSFGPRMTTLINLGGHPAAPEAPSTVGDKPDGEPTNLTLEHWLGTLSPSETTR